MGIGLSDGLSVVRVIVEDILPTNLNKKMSKMEVRLFDWLSLRDG